MELGLLARSPESLRREIVSALRIDPAVKDHEIGVAAEDGVVTLTGNVGSFRAKVAAERAVKRIEGIRSVANNIHVKVRNERSDTEIAREALHRLRNNVAVPTSVQAVVSDGHITLDGTVTWMHQRAAAETAVKYLPGVKSVTNDIALVAPESH
jgi:osmotically-inducible protein OsmY